MSRSPWALAVAAASLLAALSGCGAGAAPDGEASSDAGVSVSVYQPRPDVAAGRMAIQVHNDSGEDLTIEGAELTSSYFQDDLVWPGGHDVHVLSGRAVDLRVDIGESDCAQPNPAKHSVTLIYRLGDGPSTTASFTPGDGFDLLDRLRDDACLGQRVATVATLTAATVAAPGQPGVPTTLTITVVPTGVSGIVRVDAVNSTTLLEPFDGTTGVGELALGITVDAGGPGQITIPLVPNRCDAHALAEDKVGTRIPLQVTAPDGTQGRLVLSASDELRMQMYEFYSTYCGLG